MRLRALGAALLIAGCTAAPVRIADPVAFETFCGARTIQPQVLKSLLTSADDRPLPEMPNEIAVRTALRNHGGVIAYWDDQPLALPQTAAILGERDGYARLRALAVTVGPANDTSRRIYLLVRDHSLVRWLVEHSAGSGSICTAAKS
ncbi:MAG: hypothetical protein WAJ85_12300 [Candidatus Baltobacteraceae bacterium]|jgi:hypothetical protein